MRAGEYFGGALGRAGGQDGQSANVGGQHEGFNVGIRVAERIQQARLRFDAEYALICGGCVRTSTTEISRSRAMLRARLMLVKVLPSPGRAGP
jgi:hypothetical protein